MVDLSTILPDDIRKMSRDRLAATASEVLTQQQADRRENQILYYRPASKTAEAIHYSTASIIGVGGGNRSSKTNTCMVDWVGRATGMFPIDHFDAFMAKFRGPIRIRMCVESFTTVLAPIILPKLKWWIWEGIDDPGGDRGHWGWVPKLCLRDGSWDKSWSEKYRTLTVLCRNPKNLDEVLGDSVIQFLSYDQDPEDYEAGTFKVIHMDEPPPFPVWRVNQARVLDVDGDILISMTWPDDPSIPIDWIFDEVYEKGSPGPNKDPDVEWFELNTLDNVHLDREITLKKSRSWSEQTRLVKIEGQPLRFSNRIHPLFTDTPATWCFTCGRNCHPAADRCGCERQSVDIVEYCHVEEHEIGESWPAVFLLDPHPRKPHMFCWVIIDPSDDLYLYAQGEIDGDPADVRAYAEQIEEQFTLNTKLRLIDPNMGRSPSGARREVTWQDEFDAAGLMCDLADDSGVGRRRIDQFLKPDERTRRPRLTIHPRCLTPIQQMKRYVWDDYRRTMERDLKQIPKAKYDDYPTLLKYCLNWLPTFRTLNAGSPVMERPGTRKGAY